MISYFDRLRELELVKEIYICKYSATFYSTKAEIISLHQHKKIVRHGADPTNWIPSAEACRAGQGSNGHPKPRHLGVGSRG